MKCPDCRLCLDIFSLFVDESVQYFYRCELCQSVYRNVRGKPELVREDEIEILTRIEEQYERSKSKSQQA